MSISSATESTAPIGSSSLEGQEDPKTLIKEGKECIGEGKLERALDIISKLFTLAELKKIKHSKIMDLCGSFIDRDPINAQRMLFPILELYYRITFNEEDNSWNFNSRLDLCSYSFETISKEVLENPKLYASFLENGYHKYHIDKLFKLGLDNPGRASECLEKATTHLLSIRTIEEHFLELWCVIALAATSHLEKEFYNLIAHAKDKAKELACPKQQEGVMAYTSLIQAEYCLMHGDKDGFDQHLSDASDRISKCTDLKPLQDFVDGLKKQAAKISAPSELIPHIQKV